MNQTILAFDFGTKSIGCAIGQTITQTARMLTSFKAKDGIPDWPQIEKILEEWQPNLIIVGLPLNIDGTEQPLTQLARKFANRIHGRFGFQVILHDERLTTVEAKASIFEKKGYRGLDKSKIDATAAAIILTSWFENHSTTA